MYKDQDKFKAKGITEGITDTKRVIPNRGKFIDEQGNAHVPDAEFTKLMAQAGPGHVRVSKPGDADYEPLEQYKAEFKERHGLSRTSSTKGARL